MLTLKNMVIFYLFITIVLLGTPSSLHADGESIFIYSDGQNANIGVAFNFYPSGYSDGWHWGYMAGKHEYGSHEMLCGEYGAAISYDGIHGNHANWLEAHFSYPPWAPDTGFVDTSSNPSDYIVWQNSRSARSIIYDPNVQVTIDYRLIDLGEDGFASIPFKQSNGVNAYVQSERYVLVQTYNITNTRATDVTGLKFFQMLSAWFLGVQNSTYTNTIIPNLLPGSYDPCNPNSPAVFKYAITQWGPANTHGTTDWVNFSSTIEPNWIDSGIYSGSGGDNTSGYTTYRIKNCSLNNDPDIYNTSGPAGAMGWDMGTLTPGQTKSITLAVMFGCGDVMTATYPFEFSKQDDVPTGQSRLPGDYVTYTINFDYNGSDYGPLSASIVDTLPSQIDHTDVVASDYGQYDPVANTVTWDLVSISHGQSGSVTVRIKINEQAPSQGQIVNTATLYLGGLDSKTVTKTTNIACWGKIKNITKNKWYCDIQSAVDDANINGHDVINIWPGTYAGTNNTRVLISNKSLDIIAVDSDYRRTRIDLKSSRRESVDYCFKFINSQGSQLSGFTIQNGYYGVWVQDCNITIENCWTTNNNWCIHCLSTYSNHPYNFIIKKSLITNSYGNTGGGIEAVGNLALTDSVVTNNGSIGIVTKSCIIKNCVIGDNKGPAIEASGLVKIKNCTIYDKSTYPDVVVSLGDLLPGSEIYNNTIFCRSSLSTGVQINGSTQPKIQNCIIWGQHPLYAPNYDVKYCCVQGDPAYGGANSHNINSDPQFLNTSDYRIKSTSPCINMGDPNYVPDAGETDIDKEPRVCFGRIDMGSDERDSRVADFDLSGKVNFVDYSQFLKQWGKTPTSPGWVDTYNLYPDSIIDTKDLREFVNDWLWRAGYTMSLAEAFGFAGFDIPQQTLPPPGDGSVWLVCEPNAPDPNTEVTVYYYSSVPLSSIAAGIEVKGDAMITHAMDINDCNQYGWTPDWWTSSEIDPNGTWAYIGDYSEAGTSTGYVGYFTLHYNGGPVDISVTEDSQAVDANGLEAVISLEPISLGGEQMMMQGESMMMQSVEQPVDTEQLVQWLEDLWNNEQDIRNSFTESDWQEFINAVQNSQ